MHMHVDARAYDDIWKKQFPGAPSRDLEWENKNLRAKKVYWFGIGIFLLSTVLLMTENSNERKDIVQQV